MICDGHEQSLLWERPKRERKREREDGEERREVTKERERKRIPGSIKLPKCRKSQ